MQTVTSIAGLRATVERWRINGASVGFVPTMGYFHEGHISMIRAAANANDHVVVSLFVNPMQFAAGEDLGSYPRDIEGDAAKAMSAGAQVMFCPSVHEIYPDSTPGRNGTLTTVGVAALAEVMEGASRPTHFVGVCTVVAKLFNLIGPCRAYFGEKDYQQLAIIRQMVRDLSFPVDIVGCETIREADGLAMSSRNVYLDSEERLAAPVLNRALRAGAESIMGGETDRDSVLRVMLDVIHQEPMATLDYLEIADPVTLSPQEVVDSRARLFGAVKFSKARLIDNIGVDSSAPSDSFDGSGDGDGDGPVSGSECA